MRYPCQRVAFPLAWGFVGWLAGLFASGMAFMKARSQLARRRYTVGLISMTLATGITWLALSPTGDKLVLAQPQPPNNPIGVAQGIHPGRVVWVHDPDATDWAGPGNGHWWEPNHTNQAVVSQMMSRALQELTGERNDAVAWDRLFRHINHKRGKENVAYQPGEKIAIKVNFVGLIWRGGGVNPDTYNLDSQRNYMNTSPQVTLALLRQLVRTVGVKESDISVGDTLAYFPNEYYNILHNEFPDVRYMDHAGKFNRVKVTRSKVAVYWSSRPQGVRTDYVPLCYAEADYLINLANLKAHTGAGITLCAKNHFGSLIRWPAEEGYYDLHTSGFATGMGKYRNLVDLMGHAHIGGKAVLYLIDGLYAGVHPRDQAPTRWNSDPFNGDWTSSLFASQDPVAIDSVAFDFLWTEWSDYPHQSGADDYLHEAALANSPPSGTFYDPNHSTSHGRLPSLGVHEHWNSPQQKKYSRNLGTGLGIELIAVTGSTPTALSVEDIRLSSKGHVSLNWTDPDPDLLYSVEFAGSLLGGKWDLMPPVDQWPTDTTGWTDTSVSGTGTR
ncbi:MAG: DUF362 domain-containing protein, partial [Thermodesulfobacteriota bacterium]|nr:DUF362 domain-containing protein [Thermodesulfobacteriota bacterium]